MEDKIEKPLRKPVFMNTHPRRRQNFGSQPETDDYIAFDHCPEKNINVYKVERGMIFLPHMVKVGFGGDPPNHKEVDKEDMEGSWSRH